MELHAQQIIAQPQTDAFKSEQVQGRDGGHQNQRQWSAQVAAQRLDTHHHAKAHQKMGERKGCPLRSQATQREQGHGQAQQ